MSVTDRIKKSNIYSTSIASNSNNTNSNRYKDTNSRNIYNKKVNYQKNKMY